jgi:uncharacterized protein YjiS (DUF1127 family)
MKHTNNQMTQTKTNLDRNEQMATFSTNTPAIAAHTFSIKAVFNAISTLREVAKQRRALGKLDASRLEDLGITAHAAKAEADKPFWSAPNHWKM